MNFRFGLGMRCAIAFWLAAMGGCSSNQGDPNTIRIVSSLPHTGTAAKQSETIVNGIRLAIEEAGGKVGPYAIEYTRMDDANAASQEWAPDVEANNARQAVQDPNVMVYIGTYNSGAAKISMPILNREKLMMISPSNTASELTKREYGKDSTELDRYRPTGEVTYFRIVPTDDIQGPCGADWAKDLGVKRVYILDDQQIYGAGVARAFRDRCEEIGIDVVGSQSFDPKGTQEFRALMTAIKNTNADMIYFGGTTQSKGGQLVKDMVAAGMGSCKFMAPDGCVEQAFIDSAGNDNVEGRCYFTFGGLPPAELKGKGRDFVENYRRRYKSEPEAYAAYGYECAQVALEAIRRAGKKDREAISAACRGIKDFDGALGEWSFDENGDTTLRVMSGQVVKDGKFVFVKLLESKADNEKPAKSKSSGPKT